MGLWDTLRKLRRSVGPDSYSRYKGEREYERKRTDREREQEEGEAARKHEVAERESGYEERYARERERDTGSE
jgi:hypothetical protein